MSALLKRHKDLTPWTYRCTESMQGQALAYFRGGPLNALLCDMDGIAYWCLSTVNGKMRQPRNGKLVWVTPDGDFDPEDPETSNLDGMVYWHPRKNVVPTRRFMALVEGLEDVAMIHALRERNPEHPLVSDAALVELYNSESLEEYGAWRDKILETLSNNR
jgi:hypothetical protein